MIAGRFRNRREAGRLLAAKLAAYANRPDVIVLALPRGGVPVAYEVASALNAPLDAFLHCGEVPALASSVLTDLNDRLVCATTEPSARSSHGLLGPRTPQRFSSSISCSAAGRRTSAGYSTAIRKRRISLDPIDALRCE